MRYAIKTIFKYMLIIIEFWHISTNLEYSCCNFMNHRKLKNARKIIFFIFLKLLE